MTFKKLRADVKSSAGEKITVTFAAADSEPRIKAD
jgi:hypothetical protein